MSSSAPRLDAWSGSLLLVLAAVWGGAFFFSDIALRELPPITIAFFRVLLALLPLFIVVRWKRLSIPTSLHVWLCYLVMGALNNAIPFSLIFWGQQSIGSGLASILNGTTAVLGALVAGLLLADERLTRAKVIGAVLGLCGVAATIGFESLLAFDLSSVSQLAILGAALSYAFAGVWGKRTLSAFPPVVNAFGMLCGSTVLLLPTVLFVEGAPELQLSSEVWLSLLALAILSTAFAYLLYFEILRRAGSANLMLVTLLIPVVAVSLAWMFFDEGLSPEAGVGFALIALGLTVTDGRLFSALHRWLKGRG